ncbi:TetR/AcrR family transcriptional regulator [Collinsella stercoris]|uniref:TetR/AcrR family transcriptional regulator n=1 Tax=Collinsella stercoris TaxID=147206 RepID=UPI003992DA61
MDLRIQKTYRSLLAAFTRLLETHRYEDVTVAMLCDEAMIRRTTFYKHFADKAEFFSFFVDSLRIEITNYGEQQTAAARGRGRRERRGRRGRGPGDPAGLRRLHARAREDGREHL